MFKNFKFKAHLTEWSPWTACSDCSPNGFKFRQRTCSGSSCSKLTPLYEKVLCFQQTTNNNNPKILSTTPTPPIIPTYTEPMTTTTSFIPTTTIHLAPPHIISPDMSLIQWAPWSECSVQCGFGYRSRTKHCDQTKYNCIGNSIEYEACYSAKCSTKMQRFGPVWSEWSDWSSCLPGCGSGVRERRRSCQNQSANPNQNCFGSDVEFMNCQEAECNSGRLFLNEIKPSRF